MTWRRTSCSLFLPIFQNKVLNRFYWTSASPQVWVNESHLMLETLAESLSTSFTFYSPSRFGQKEMEQCMQREREEEFVLHLSEKKGTGRERNQAGRQAIISSINRIDKRNPSKTEPELSSPAAEESKHHPCMFTSAEKKGHRNGSLSHLS